MYKPESIWKNSKKVFAKRFTSVAECKEGENEREKKKQVSNVFNDCAQNYKNMKQKNANNARVAQKP